MAKKPLPSCFAGKSPAQAADELHYRLSCDADGNPTLLVDYPVLQTVVAWVLSSFQLTSEEEKCFLAVLGLVKQPTPSGTWEIVEDNYDVRLPAK